MQMVKAQTAPSSGSRALAAALAQFDAAADHIALEPGLRAVLRVAATRVHCPFPGQAGRRLGGGLSGLPRPAQRGARAGKRRAAIPSQDRSRRRPRAGDVDDLEGGPGRRAVRRRQRRRDLRSEFDEPEGARGPDPPVRDGARGDHRPGLGHPGTGRRDERPDDGLDHGHRLDAPGLLGARRRDRQADRDRRFGRPGGRDGSGRRLHDRGRGSPGRLRTRRLPRGGPGLRQRRRGDGASSP